VPRRRAGTAFKIKPDTAANGINFDIAGDMQVPARDTSRDQ